MNQAGEQSKAEYYRLIRGQIEHHDNLVNQRVIWQIISQSFFFGAYASLLNAPKEAKSPIFEAEQLLLIWLLPIAGLLAGALTYASIIASLKSIEHLHGLYDEYVGSRPDDISNKLFPHIQGPSLSAQIGKGLAYLDANYFQRCMVAYPSLANLGCLAALIRLCNGLRAFCTRMRRIVRLG
jgi:hypothetical protein